ncbi:hypothetical protein BC939DRAFT_497157 [Gamsiella multidivaricata]|uniref:uncharacterized protein n=1 Tax=Gamsiella multidivaricata TaxID=101098 RepID=UPI0022205EEC|nr:uncharacterized protein BC939DRAFT_497157 [Gamsiella multidivaricata]KAI7816778.1 hypothetical protein BC939DRAFT_497157 [Gamsiella multidivaricata]
MVNLKLSCLVGWESTSRAFLISASSTLTITDLKELIKAEKVPEFDEIAAENLILWRILVPVIATRGHDSVKLDALDDKEELPPSDDLLDFFPDTPAKKAIHIIVELPPLGSSVSAALSLPLKRGREQELEDPQKLPKTDDWVKYNAKDRAVDLPPLLVSMLNAGEFTPEPRDEFKQQLDDMQVGQQIILPSIGQRPKHYGQGYQKLSFFITEQMVEMWRLLSSNNDRPIRRILSGPVGVGKSYLALFLATKAYAEAWPLLYFSDAKKLALSDGYDVAQEIYERFLALNKDILTVTDSQESTHGHPTGSTVVIHAATSILGRLLQQRETKTLLVVDGHGALFEQDPPVPKKYMIFNPLMQLAAWRENSRGARVVMAGTAEKFERHCIKNDMWNWLEYVTPLSDTIFDKLLDMDAILSRAAIREQVKKTTNRAPRELVSMAAFICQNLQSIQTPTPIKLSCPE